MPRDDSENLGNGPAFACARNVLTIYFAYVDSSNLCRKLHKFSSFITCISSSLKYSYIHETCMKHRPRNMGKQITIIDTFSVLCFASSFIQNNIIFSCIQFPMQAALRSVFNYVNPQQKINIKIQKSNFIYYCLNLWCYLYFLMMLKVVLLHCLTPHGRLARQRKRLAVVQCSRYFFTAQGQAPSQISTRQITLHSICQFLPHVTHGTPESCTGVEYLIRST